VVQNVEDRSIRDGPFLYDSTFNFTLFFSLNKIQNNFFGNLNQEGPRGGTNYLACVTESLANARLSMHGGAWDASFRFGNSFLVTKIT